MAGLTAGCAVESYPGLGSSNELKAPVLTSDEQKEVIRDLNAAKEQHRAPGSAEEQKTQ